MSERVTIKIQPSGGVTNSLTVEDAMQQVLDYIDLLRSADLSEAGEEIVWRLESAQTNSPLEVTAFATGPDPAVSVAYQARQTAERLSKGITTLETGGSVPSWMDTKACKIAKRFFKRNMNGIGRTDISISDVDTTTVVHSTAKIAALSIERNRIDLQLQKPDWTRTEYGSVEGEIISTTRVYTRPAVVIIERLSGSKIKCILSNELAEKAGPTHSWEETWGQRRFSISGELHFNSDGNLLKINATDLREISYEPVDLQEIRRLNLLKDVEVNNLNERLWGDG